MLRSWVPTASSSSRFWRPRTSTPTITTLRKVSSANASARRTARRRQTGSAGRADDTGLIASAVPGIRRLQADGAIDRPGAAAAGEQEEQDRGPGQVLGVGIR